MKKDQIHENGTTTTFTYDQPVAQNAQEAVNWLLGLEEREGFETAYIALRDLSRSADEGNESRQFKSTVSAEQILEALEEASFERLYLAGRLNGVPVGIGISLKDYIPSVTVPKECAELAEKIAGCARGLGDEVFIHDR